MTLSLKTKKPNILIHLGDEKESVISLYIPEEYQSAVVDAIKEAFRLGVKSGVQQYKEEVDKLIMPS